MRPDAKRKLDRLLWSHKLKTQVLPAALLIALFAAFGISYLDAWTPVRVLAGEVLHPPGIDSEETIGNYAFTARLESGKTVRVKSEMRIMAPKGARVSVQEEVSRILRRKRYRLIRVEPAADR